MGVYPRVFLDRSKASVETIQRRVVPGPAGGSFTTRTFLPQRRKDGE